MGKKIWFTLILFLFILIGSNFVSSINSPEYAIISFDFSSVNLPGGNWQFSLVDLSSKDISEYKKMEILEKVIKDYYKIKNKCGVLDYVLSGFTSMGTSPQELLDLKEVKIRFDSKHDKYFFIEDPNFFECANSNSLDSYNGDFESILNNSYKMITNFWIYTYNKGNEYGAGFGYSTICEIKDGFCKIAIYSNGGGPYVFALEKMESKNEIYFSDPTIINWNTTGDFVLSRNYGDSSKIYDKKIISLNIYNNFLDFDFDGTNQINKEELNKTNPKLKNIFFRIILFAIIIFIFIFIKVRKKIRKSKVVNKN